MTGFLTLEMDHKEKGNTDNTIVSRSTLYYEECGTKRFEGVNIY